MQIWKGLPKPQQWNTTDQKGEQDKPQFMTIKFQNSMILMHRNRQCTGIWQISLFRQLHQHTHITLLSIWATFNIEKDVSLIFNRDCIRSLLLTNYQFLIMGIMFPGYWLSNTKKILDFIPTTYSWLLMDKSIYLHSNDE